jgi:FdhD protein
MNAVPKLADLTIDPSTLSSRRVEGVAYDAQGNATPVFWNVPDEVPVAIQYNSEPFTVMMATPSDLRDFGLGLSLAEGIIANASDVRGILVMPVNDGLAIDIAIDPEALDLGRLARRSIEGRTGCGLCGVEDIAEVVRKVDPVSARVKPSPDAILKAAAALPALQPMNRLNRTVHAAAWVSLAGDVLIVREDVGRHNALDKLIGALATSATDLTSGFVLMTSRCSFELVQKAATVGISSLVTVSAPTALALEIAKRSEMFLASLGNGGVVVFHS